MSQSLRERGDPVEADREAEATSEKDYVLVPCGEPTCKRVMMWPGTTEAALQQLSVMPKKTLCFRCSGDD